MKELKERMIKYAKEKGIDYTELVNQSAYDVNPVFSEEIVDIACERLGVACEYCDFGEDYMNEVEEIANELLA